jgi:hypothetical protein
LVDEIGKGEMKFTTLEKIASFFEALRQSQPGPTGLAAKHLTTEHDADKDKL